ncbi:MAG: hypothetical protein ABI268_12130 [Rhodanobacter sp.]
MNDHAYDISHLLAPDALPAVATPDIVSAPRASVGAPKPSEPVSPQAALAMELMQGASVHDAFVDQFLRMDSDGSRDSCV